MSDGVKKTGCVGNVGTRGGARIGVSFFVVTPDGLKTSTYDFLSASNGWLVIGILRTEQRSILLTLVSLHFEHI